MSRSATNNIYIYINYGKKTYRANGYHNNESRDIKKKKTESLPEIILVIVVFLVREMKCIAKSIRGKYERLCKYLVVRRVAN